MHKVEVANHQHSLSIDAETLREVVRQTLTFERVTASTISLAIVDGRTIHELNREYLNHDFETDVLSFLLDCSGGRTADDAVSELPRGADKTIDGEVIVCSDYATHTALEFGWDPISEMTLYVIHGLLHLCGYDDLTTSERQIMRQREREVLALIGLEQPLSDPSSTSTSARRDT